MASRVSVDTSASGAEDVHLTPHQTNGAPPASAGLSEGLPPYVEDFVREPRLLLIDGKWVEAVSGKTFETFNPATEEVLGSVAHGGAEDIELAVRAARRCFDDERSDWRRMTPSERGKVIHRIGDLIEQHADELAMARDARQRQAANGRQSGGCRAVR
jgi:predicted Fe-S protein YdhL (DUF1289 family)